MLVPLNNGQNPPKDVVFTPYPNDFVVNKVPHIMFFMFYNEICHSVHLVSEFLQEFALPLFVLHAQMLAQNSLAFL